MSSELLITNYLDIPPRPQRANQTTIVGPLKDWRSGGSKASYSCLFTLYYISKIRVYQCSVISKSLRNCDIYGVYSDIFL